MYKFAFAKQLGVAALLSLVLIVSAQAQADRKSSVNGTVRNSSGGPIVSITVQLESIDSGVTRQATSDASGKYRFDDVAPGRYRMSTISSQDGAASSPSGEVSVASGAVEVVNLTIGAPSRTVVATTNPVTTTQEATAIDELTGPRISASHNTRDIEYQPSASYLGRNGAMFGADNLSLLSAGVASNGGLGARGPVVGGQRPSANNFYMEGIDNTNHPLPGPLAMASNEAVSEFTTLQNQFPPEFGHTTGGQLNSILRTGTNEVHGTLFEYFQNRNLNAMDQYFARQGFTDNPRYDQNRLGGDLGFPILKNKLFFFGDFEFIPLGFASAPVSPVFGPTTAGYAMLGSMTGISQTNLQFLSNVLPAAQNGTTFTTINGAQIPLGVVSLTGRGYQNRYNGVGAMDWKIGQSDSLQARYAHNELHANNNGAALPAFFTPMRTRNLLASLSEVHNFAGGTINELRLGYNHFGENILPGARAFPNLGVAGVPFVSFPSMNLQLGQGLAGPQSAGLNTYNLADNVHWRVGRHNILFGADARRFIGAENFPQLGAGSYLYGTLAGFVANLPPDLSGERAIGSLRYDTNQWDTYAYVKDEWRVRPNMEVDLGLRYEFASLPADLRRQSQNAIANVPGVLTFGIPGVQRSGFAPQVGFAFSPGAERNSVFRAGFGMNYDVNAYTALAPYFAPGLATTLYTNGLPSTSGFFGPAGFFSPTFGSNLSPQARTTTYIPDQKFPYTMQWNASWQQTVLHRFLLEVRYLGVRGVHLPASDILNQGSLTANNSLPVYFAPQSQTTLDSLTTSLNSLQAVSPQFAAAGFTSPILETTTSGNSMYNGLAVEGRQRFSGGFQLLAAYTWSHLIDDVTPLMLGPTPTFAFLEQRTTRDSSVFDHRQRGTLTYLWDVGALGSGGFKWYRDIVANFIIAGTYIYETPAPMPFLSGSPSSFFGLGGGVIANPNGVPGTGSGVIPLTNSQGQVVAYQATNPNAQFIAGAPGTFTNAGRINFNGMAPINNFDLSVTKRFGIRDRFNLEVRADAYNLFNHPQFTPGELSNIGLPSLQTQTFSYLIPSAPAFGNVQSGLASHARMMQLALRLVF
jgi:hypothetical protein